MAVIFDNDGVLANTEETAVLNDPRFLRQFGLDYTTSEYADLIAGKMHDDFMRALEADALRLTGRSLPPDFKEKLKNNYYWQVENVVMRVPDVDKVIDKVEQLRETFAVASNGEMGTLRQKLRKVCFLNDFIPHIYNKDHVGGKGKPAPDLFLYVMKQLNEADPSFCTVIEDSPSGVMAGAAAGMHVIGYSGGKHRAQGYEQVLLDAGANEISDSMLEVRDMVERRILQNRARRPGLTPDKLQP